MAKLNVIFLIKFFQVCQVHCGLKLLLQKKKAKKTKKQLFPLFSPARIKPKRVAPTAPESFVCALSFMETLGQGGAGTCKSTDLL